MHNIVLASQNITKPDGFQIHGIFPSFAAAIRHIAKDEDFSEQLLRSELEVNSTCIGVTQTYQFVRPQKDGTEVHWTASIQPLRNEEGI